MLRRRQPYRLPPSLLSARRQKNLEDQGPHLLTATHPSWQQPQDELIHWMKKNRRPPGYASGAAERQETCHLALRKCCHLSP